MAESVAPPTFAEALRFWFKLGLINFGGPAGQIAIMHEELVERKRWIGHARFMHALNYCMLLPGPEAMQLATYIGWLLHGIAGGLVAGTLFILPGAALIYALSVVYALYGEVRWVSGIFYGLGPAVIALVVAAVIRIARKGLNHAALYAVAAGAFVAIFFFSIPFPAIIATAVLIGLIGARFRPAWFRPTGHGTPEKETAAAIDDRTFLASHTQASWKRAMGLTAVHLALWAAPIVALGLLRGWNDLFVRISVFFSIAALVTFGGAYAVLGYVAQAGVTRFEWLGAHDMTVGLGLAESTPGPLILVVQFVGFLAGFNHAPAGMSPLAAATLGASLALWVTFVPCFLWILVGAPFVERLRGHRALDAALTTVTAAVVGVILNLAIWLALRVLFGRVRVDHHGLLTLNVPDVRSLDIVALMLALTGFAVLVRFKRSMIAVILASAGLGLVWKLI